jgi:hypothetical protein
MWERDATTIVQQASTTGSLQVNLQDKPKEAKEEFDQ